MGYRTIVVGTDGSPTATIARDVALRFAKRCHAHLVKPVSLLDLQKVLAGVAGDEGQKHPVRQS